MSNVGSIDRNARLFVGIILIALFFLPPSAPILAGFGLWRWVMGAVGVLMLATAVFRFCPAYTLFHVNTCPGK